MRFQFIGPFDSEEFTWLVVDTEKELSYPFIKETSAVTATDLFNSDPDVTKSFMYFTPEQVLAILE